MQLLILPMTLKIFRVDKSCRSEIFLMFPTDCQHINMTPELSRCYMDLAKRQYFNCKQLFLTDERDFAYQVLNEKSKLKFKT